MNSRFQFPIFPDRIYTLDYGDITAEVTGQEILAAFRREAYLQQILSNTDWETNV